MPDWLVIWLNWFCVHLPFIFMCCDNGHRRSMLIEKNHTKWPIKCESPSLSLFPFFYGRTNERANECIEKSGRIYRCRGRHCRRCCRPYSTHRERDSIIIIIIMIHRKIGTNQQNVKRNQQQKYANEETLLHTQTRQKTGTYTKICSLQIYAHGALAVKLIEGQHWFLSHTYRYVYTFECFEKSIFEKKKPQLCDIRIYWLFMLFFLVVLSD